MSQSNSLSNTNLQALLGLLVCIIFQACNPSVQIDFPQQQPKLVVWGYLEADAYPYYVRVQRTQTPLETREDRTLTDALVVMETETLGKDTFYYNADTLGYFSSRITELPEGEKVRILVSHEGYESVYTDWKSVPKKPFVDSTSYSKEYIYARGVIVYTKIHLRDRLDSKGGVFKVYNEVYNSANSDWFAMSGSECSYGERRSSTYQYGYINKSEDVTFNIVDYSCFDEPPKDLSLQSLNGYQDVYPIPIKLKICNCQTDAIEYHKKMSEYKVAHFQNNLDWIGYEPIYLPEVIQEGLGYFGVINCAGDINILVEE